MPGWPGPCVVREGNLGALLGFMEALDSGDGRGSTYPEGLDPECFTQHRVELMA
jgi:hypothetical protein